MSGSAGLCCLHNRCNGEILQEKNMENLRFFFFLEEKKKKEVKHNLVFLFLSKDCASPFVQSPSKWGHYESASPMDMHEAIFNVRVTWMVKFYP